MRWRERLGFRPRMEDFARMLLDEFLRRGAEDWTYDAPNALLRHGGESGAQINLVNIFLEYCQATKFERLALIQKYAAFCEAQRQGVPKLWELAAKSIFPVVRSYRGSLGRDLSCSWDGRELWRLRQFLGGCASQLK